MCNYLLRNVRFQIWKYIVEVQRQGSTEFGTPLIHLTISQIRDKFKARDILSDKRKGKPVRLQPRLLYWNSLQICHIIGDNKVARKFTYFMVKCFKLGIKTTIAFKSQITQNAHGECNKRNRNRFNLHEIQKQIMHIFQNYVWSENQSDSHLEVPIKLTN